MQVQLGAMASQQAADAEWQRLQRKMPDLLNGRSPLITKIERDGKTFYRIRTAGFTDAAQAKSFCSKIIAEGANCSVANF